MKDVVGAVISALCVAHCLLIPIALTLGSTGLMATTHHSPEVHIAFFIPVLLVAALSFPKSRRIHHEHLPGKLAIVGLTLLGSALVVEPLLHWHVVESIVTVLGGLILIYAHTLNRKLLLGNSSKTCTKAVGDSL